MVLTLTRPNLHVEGPRGRPHVLLVIGRSVLHPQALRQVAWLGQHLRAHILVTCAVEYTPPYDELVKTHMEWASGAVKATREQLASAGVEATSMAVLTDRNAATAMALLADEHEADLVAIVSRHRSWFRWFPGSAIAHHLTRTGRRPVVLISGHVPGLRARLRNALQRPAAAWP